LATSLWKPCLSCKFRDSTIRGINLTPTLFLT
jgi:hypothetical protein